MPTQDELQDRIYIQGVHLDITEAMRQAIAEKFRPVMRRSTEIVRLNVRIAQDQRRGDVLYFAGTAQLEIRGPDLVAHSEGTEVYAILDDMVEKLDHALERRHGRRKDQRNHPQPIELEADLPKVQGPAAPEAG